MTTFLNFNVFAAARGEGLRPELRLFFERAATSPFSDVAIRRDGPVLRIVGYQEHVLRNVQPRQQRAKTDAADTNSSSIF